MTTNSPIVDELYSFYIVTPLTNNSCKLKAEAYWKVKSPFKKIIINLIAKMVGRKIMQSELDNLFQFVKKER
jgi:hypothetical protein